MKQKDIALIIVIVAVSGIFSFIVGRMLFSSPKDRQEKVEVVEAITTTFPSPDSKYFNANSINPTRIIQISENSNDTPFSGL